MDVTHIRRFPALNCSFLHTANSQPWKERQPGERLELLTVSLLLSWRMILHTPHVGGGCCNVQSWCANDLFEKSVPQDVGWCVNSMVRGVLTLFGCFQDIPFPHVYLFSFENFSHLYKRTLSYAAA